MNIRQDSCVVSCSGSTDFILYLNCLMLSPWPSASARRAWISLSLSGSATEICTPSAKLVCPALSANCALNLPLCHCRLCIRSRARPMSSCALRSASVSSTTASAIRSAPRSRARARALKKDSSEKCKAKRYNRHAVALRTQRDV